MSNTNNTSTSHAYFNLLDYIEHVQCVDVAAEMAKAVAFRVDVSLAGECRNLLKSLRGVSIDFGIDTAAELIKAVQDAAFAEEAMKACGHAAEGPVQRIAELNAIRQAVIDMTSELVGMTYNWDGTPRVFNAPDMDDVLLREVTLSVKPVQKSRIEQMVRRRADGAKDEDIAKVLERHLQREEQKAKDKSEALTQQGPALLSLFNLAIARSDVIASDVEFHTLTANTRRTLIDAALKGAARAEDYASGNSNLSDGEFDHICFGVIKVERELKAVLNSPAYHRESMMADI